MSSTPQTRGFNLSVLPQYSGPDPRLFNLGSPIAAGLTSGVEMGGRLQDINLRREQADYAASLRPRQEQLMDIQLEGAGVGLEGAKAARHLADIALPTKEIEAKQPVILEENTFMDFDENRNLAEYKRQKKQDPMTGEVSYAPRIYNKTVKTKAQLASDAAYGAARTKSLEAGATERLNKGPRFESELIAQKMAQARQDGDEEEFAFWEARQARVNAMPGILQSGTVAGRAVETIGTKAGFTVDQLRELQKSPYGVSAMMKIQNQNDFRNKNMFESPAYVLSAEEQAAVDAARKFVPTAVSAAAPAAVSTQPTPRAIRALILNPALAAEFNKKYGQGAAEAYLQ